MTFAPKRETDVILQTTHDVDRWSQIWIVVTTHESSNWCENQYQYPGHTRELCN